MKNRFIIIADDISKEQQNIITNYFSDQKSGYWHWFKDCWLITDPTGKWSVATLRDKVNALVPGVNILVMKIHSGGDWAGFGGKDTFNWLHETWKD